MIPKPKAISGKDVAAPIPCPDVTIVVPTYMERRNIETLIERLQVVLVGVNWEVIFVDDSSPDGTAAIAKELGQFDARIRCIRRIGRRGLAGACIEGVLASQARYICVMDADLQHDENLIPQMLNVLQRNECDLIIASRYMTDEPIAGLTGRREHLSRFATLLSRRFLHITLSDPLSGFFAMRRDMFDDIAAKLSPDGFKLLLNIVLVEGPHLNIIEIPFGFRARHHGESKLDTRATLDFCALLLSQATANIIPQRFLLFFAVGLSGIAVHFLMLKLLMIGDSNFIYAQGAAAAVAIVSNFWLNNNLTYRDQKLSGIDALRGFALFVLICSFGFVSNISISDWIFVGDKAWWLAGFAGAVVSAVWNYSVSAALVWRR